MKRDNRVEILISMIKDNYNLAYDENKIRELNEKTIRNICKEYFEEVNELEEEIKIFKEVVRNKQKEITQLQVDLEIKTNTIKQIKELTK